MVLIGVHPGHGVCPGKDGDDDDLTYDEPWSQGKLVSARGVEKEDQQVWDHVGDREVGVPLQLRHQMACSQSRILRQNFSWISRLDFFLN